MTKSEFLRECSNLYDGFEKDSGVQAMSATVLVASTEPDKGYTITKSIVIGHMSYTGLFSCMEELVEHYDKVSKDLLQKR